MSKEIEHLQEPLLQQDQSSNNLDLERARSSQKPQRKNNSHENSFQQDPNLSQNRSKIVGTQNDKFLRIDDSRMLNVSAMSTSGYFERPSLRRIQSENDIFAKDSKESNLMKIIHEDLKLENYLAMHKYGLVKVPQKVKEMANDTTFIQKKKQIRSETSKVGKVGPLKTFIALIKGYCAIVILIIPKSFINGGYLFSPIALAISAMITTFCALKLVQAGLKTRVMDYSMIGQKALGFHGKVAIDIMIALTQITFLITQVSFVTTVFQNGVLYFFNKFIDKWSFAILIIIIYTLLSWVRKIQKFSFAYMIGSFIILFVCTIIAIYCGQKLSVDGIGPNIQPFNDNLYWNMIGFSVYCFEGIGCVMPVMETCSCPKQFPKLLIGAVAVLTTIYIIFAEICYFAYGTSMTEPIMLNQLPNDSGLIQALKIIYCVNLICGYPLGIFPVNTIFEGYLFKNMKHKTQSRKWAKNTLRCIIVMIIVFLGVELASKLDKFISIIGALFCAPVAFTMPTLCHLKLVAKTKMERYIDKVIIAFSLFILIMCTYQGIQNWNTETAH